MRFEIFDANGEKGEEKEEEEEDEHVLSATISRLEKRGGEVSKFHVLFPGHLFHFEDFFVYKTWD